MRPVKSIAAAILLFLLFATVVYFRIQETKAYEQNMTDPMEICVGIVQPDGRFGIVRADTTEALMHRAASDLLLPEECVSAAKGYEVHSGEEAVFRRTDDDSCILSKIDSLKGSARLLCGLKLNINREDKTGLMLLPNIGSVRAEAIIESRNKDGAFRSIENLMRVPGIGEKTAANLEQWVEF